MVTDGNQIYCDDHFAKYASAKSLCCIPETSIILYVSYTSLKKLINRPSQNQCSRWYCCNFSVEKNSREVNYTEVINRKAGDCTHKAKIAIWCYHKHKCVTFGVYGKGNTATPKNDGCEIFSIWIKYSIPEDFFTAAVKSSSRVVHGYHTLKKEG